jgi:HPt (histidine-containing phosphotransfer) domain-containing protein
MLGPQMLLILGYFREDGIKSCEAMEIAIRTDSSVDLVRPAHTLKGEAYQFGATDLGELCEMIEQIARRLVEQRSSPLELAERVARARPLFKATVHALENALKADEIIKPKPIVAMTAARKPVFGRKTA